MDGADWTRYTIRAALGLYVLYLLSLPGLGSQPLRRGLWTTAWVLFSTHALLAFHVFHDWSHVAAYTATALETREVIGWDWGGGLYLNYVFWMLWTLDVGWCWWDLRGYSRRARWMDLVLHGFLLFMAFQATVVFETGPIRWVGCILTAVLLLRWRRS